MESTKQTRENRVSRFPGTKNGEARKRTASENDEIAQMPKKATIIKKLSKEAANPWERYRKTFKINQAGPAFVVHSKTSMFQEGIVKAVKAPRSELSKIMTKHHENFVHLRETFYHDGEIFLLYELLDVCLSEIFALPIGRLQLFETAAFSKEILLGLQFLHDELKIAHGKLNSKNILLSVSGAVKIANIGTSMLENRDNGGSQNDLQALGKIILECLEPNTVITREMVLPKTWGPNISEFLEMTSVKSAQKLLKHDFIQLSPGPSCLKPYIRFAREMVRKEVTYSMNM